MEFLYYNGPLRLFNFLLLDYDLSLQSDNTLSWLDSKSDGNCYKGELGVTWNFLRSCMLKVDYKVLFKLADCHRQPMENSVVQSRPSNGMDPPGKREYRAYINHWIKTWTLGMTRQNPCMIHHMQSFYRLGCIIKFGAPARSQSLISQFINSTCQHLKSSQFYYILSHANQQANRLLSFI